MRKINKIIIHCSATPEGRDYTIDQIRQWHTLPKPKGNGWRDIGYHFIIYRDGSIHRGRPIEQVGAHSSGLNDHSIGICYIGGCATDGRTPKDTRTDAQKAALIELVRKLRNQFPDATIHGHNEMTCKRVQSEACFNYAECSRHCTGCEYAAKACPSFNVQADPELCGL